MSYIDRRDFLRLAAIGGGAFLLNTCTPRAFSGALMQEINATPEPTPLPPGVLPVAAGTLIPTFRAPATPTPIHTPFPSATPEQNKMPDTGWHVPNLEQVMAWSRDIEFWTKKLGPSQNSIFVNQWDPNQYPGYEPKNYSLNGFMNNSCGFATLTMVRRWAEYVFTGDISRETTILHTYKSLIGKTYTAGKNKNVNPIVNPDGRSTMDAPAIKDALMALDSETGYYKAVETTPPIVTSKCGDWGLCIDNPHLYGEWQGFFDKTRAEVMSKGGLAVMFIAKYNASHISLCPYLPENVKDDVIYIDSRGYNKEGIVKKGPLTDFTWAVCEICGVIPNLQ